MTDYMKRKQFHLTIAEEKILYEAAKRNNVSEAEIVRLAIQEYGKKNLAQENSLVRMGKSAKLEKHDLPKDLSEMHDHYLLEYGDDHE
ncbi:MAG TPA: hypothetical protein VGE40_00360 [Bacilli bacterium]